jgi:hypothetical protein
VKVFTDGITGLVSVYVSDMDLSDRDLLPGSGLLTPDEKRRKARADLALSVLQDYSPDPDLVEIRHLQEVNSGVWFTMARVPPVALTAA